MSPLGSGCIAPSGSLGPKDGTVACNSESLIGPRGHYKRSVYLDEAAEVLNAWSKEDFERRLVLIEICCGENSALGRLHNMVGDVLHIRVTQRHDFTHGRTVNMIAACVRGPRCNLWYLSPCTAGCGYNAKDGPNWKKDPETQLKINRNWAVHTTM